MGTAGLWSSRGPTCSKKVAARWMALTTSQLSLTLIPAPVACCPAVAQTSPALLSTAPGRAVAGSWEQLRLFAEAQLKLHTQQNPNLQKQKT